MVTLDECFEALRDTQRRRLLLALLESNPQDDTPLVTERMTLAEEEAGRALVRYQQIHLPKLEQYGFIDWDREGGQIRKGPAFEEARPLLELLDSEANVLPGNLQ